MRFSSDYDYGPLKRWLIDRDRELYEYGYTQDEVARLASAALHRHVSRNNVVRATTALTATGALQYYEGLGARPRALRHSYSAREWGAMFDFLHAHPTVANKPARKIAVAMKRGGLRGISEYAAREAARAVFGGIAR